MTYVKGASLTLTLTKSNGIETKAWGIEFNHKVTVGSYDIDLDDFCQLVLYVLQNSPLQEDDPRRTLLDLIKQMNIKSERERLWIK